MADRIFERYNEGKPDKKNTGTTDAYQKTGIRQGMYVIDLTKPMCDETGWIG